MMKSRPLCLHQRRHARFMAWPGCHCTCRYATRCPWWYPQDTVGSFVRWSSTGLLHPSACKRKMRSTALGNRVTPHTHTHTHAHTHTRTHTHPHTHTPPYTHTHTHTHTHTPPYTHTHTPVSIYPSIYPSIQLSIIYLSIYRSINVQSHTFVCTYKSKCIY